MKAAPPHRDGLDAAIELLTTARDLSLDKADELARAGQVTPVGIGFDAEVIDALLLQLESARTYRDTLRQLHRRALRVNLVLSGVGFALGMIAIALSLWRVVR